MATILRAYNDEQVLYDLDLFNEEQFLLEISAIESNEIGKVFGVSSQTFALPPTKNNQKYFGYLDDLGSTPSTAFTKRLPCQVLNDGQEIFSGFLTLNNVITNNDGKTIYNVVVVNEIIDFKLSIENLTFGDLDWSDYNHDLTYTNVSQSWDLDLFDGEVVYPLVEYGIQGNDITETTIANGGMFGTFTSQLTPLKLNDFKPAIRVSTILNKIFDSVGYSYTSSFFESEHADKIYHLSTKDDSRGIPQTTPISQSFQAYNSLAQSVNAGDDGLQLEFNTEVYDNANNYNPATFEYTAKTAGTYSFTTTLNATFNTITYPSAPRSVELTMYINGAPTSLVIPAFYNLKGYGNANTFILQANFSGVNLAQGDYVDLRISFFSDDASERLEISGGSDSFFECYESPTTTIGANVDLGGAFNPDGKVLDFINGLIQKFNLVIEPKKYEQKIFSIETFNDWVDAGDIKDWSSIVDRGVKWEINHPIQSSPKNVIFSDVEDKDSPNQYYIDNFGKIFGSITYQGDNDVSSGEKKVGTYFAPTPMKYIDGDTNVIIPQIYKSDSGAKKRIAFKPRLLYYLGKKINNTLFQRGFGGSVVSTGEWYLEDEFSVVKAQLQYPQFHHVERLPMTDTYRDLHFNAYQSWEYHQAYTNANTIRDAVYEYWSYYINELFDVDSRLVKMNILLNPTDIPTIKLNDKIFIDGHYYRINKLQANLTRETSVEVELLKTLARKLRFPRRRITTIGSATNEYTDVVAQVASGGKINYVGFETDVLITSSAIIDTAGSLDGFNTINGEVSYVPIRTTIPTNNTIKGGTNYIDDRVENAIIIGGGNTISSNTDSPIIFGNENTINEGSRNITLIGNNISVGGISGSADSVFVVNFSGSAEVSPLANNVIAFNPTSPITEADNGRTIIGNSVNQGTIYSIYENVPLASTDVVYLTSSDANHYHFQWSGGAGVATAYIPSASLAPNDGLTLRFTTDSTLAGTINVVPSDGNINGSPEKAMVSTYDSFTSQVINNNYIVISTN